MLTQEFVAVEMEVADQRHRDAQLLEPLPDRSNGRGGLARVDRDPHELGSGAREGSDLLCRTFDVGGVRVCHRLHDNGRTAAHADGADGYLDRGAARD